MEIPCSRLNVIVLKTAINALDEYVILAFFVSLVLTTITVILLVKYVTYYMQQDRKRVQHNLEMQHLPRLPVQDVEESDSEFDELWSDSGEDVDIEVDEMQSVQSKEISPNENLETNYISVFSSGINLHDNNNKCHELLTNLQNKSDTIPVSFISNDCLAASLFSDLYFTETSNSIDFSNLFYSKLTESLWLRKSIILQLLNFILGLLCEMHLISQDHSMNLQGKYEQEIEDYSTTNLQLDLSVGIAIGNIVNNMTSDLNNIGCKINVKTLETITSCFYAMHFDCLKCSACEFSAIHDFIDNHELMKLQCIMDIHCYHIQMKCRILSLPKYIDTSEADKNKINDIISEYRKNIVVVLAQLDVDFNVELQNMIWQIRKYRTDELDKLLNKYERYFNSLKYEIFKTKEKEIEEKVETFRQYIILLYKEYLKAKNQLIVELNTSEGIQIKMHYNRQYKTVISKLTELEGEMFLCLQETCNYTHVHILSITKNIQNHLKEVKEKCNVIKKQVLNNSVTLTKKWSTITAIVIDYIIKSVSSEFRLIKETFKTTVQQIPMFSEEIIIRILNSVQRKFSVIVFDIVVTLVEDFIKNIRQAYREGEDNKSFVWKLSDLRNDLIDNNRSDYAISLDQFNWLLPSEVNLNDFPLEKLLHSYKSVITDILNETVTTIIEEEIEPLQSSVTLEHYNKQCEIYQSIKDFMFAEKNKAENATQSKSKKYMSRKGSSYSEKTKIDELYETYASLLGMKETKVTEISKAVENKQLSDLLQKDKSSGIASCIAILKRELSSGDIDINNDYFVKLFKCEEEYMIKRFEKKMKSLVTDDNEDDIVKKKSKGPSMKSRNIVSPEPPPKVNVKERPGSAKQGKVTKRKVKK